MVHGVELALARKLGMRHAAIGTDAKSFASMAAPSR
jgi:hypothetical protein